MKRKLVYLLLVAILLLSGIIVYRNRPMTMNKAIKRTKKFITAINENKPESVYDYLVPSIQSLIGREGFTENFAKERSYPYLTPLYLYLDYIELNEEGTEGTVTCTVASRLPGEKMTFRIVFVNNKYYIDAFEDVANGSFIEKFKNL